MADGLNFTIPPFPDNKTINPYEYTSRPLRSSCSGLSSSLIWTMLGGMMLAVRMLWLVLRDTDEQMIEIEVDDEKVEDAEEDAEKDQRLHRNFLGFRSHRKKELKPANAKNRRLDCSQLESTYKYHLGQT